MMCRKLLVTCFGLIIVMMAGSAYAGTFQMDFTVTGLGPEDPISGSFTWEAASATAEIDEILSVDLAIASHTYLLSEIGFVNFESGSSTQLPPVSLCPVRGVQP